MWVLLTNLESRESIEWHNESENEFFVLQEGCDTSDSSSEDRTPPRRGTTTTNVFFRIVMKGNIELTNNNNTTHNHHNKEKEREKKINKGKETEVQNELPPVQARIVAVCAEWEGIETHWRWIEDNILFFFGYFDRTSPREEQELWEFLDTKTKFLAEQDPDTREKELYMEFVATGRTRKRGGSLRTIASPRTPDLSDSDSSDELVTAYKCTLVRKIPRWGEMRITKRRLAFYSQKLNTRVVVPWKKITSICASSTEGMADVEKTVPALVLKATNGSEFVFIDMEDFKGVYSQLVEAWQLYKEL